MIHSLLFLPLLITSTKSQSGSCNYGVADFLFFTLPAGEDYCQNIYLPEWAVGREIKLSYKFTCDYSGSSSQGIVSAYENNGCSGTPFNVTTLKDGHFRCCEGCEDICEWLYFDASIYTDSDCSTRDYSIYGFGFLNWIDRCVNLNDSSLYMQLNDTVFGIEEGDNQQECENGDWYSKLYVGLGCQEGEDGDGNELYLSAIVDDEDNGFSDSDSNSGSGTSATCPTVDNSHIVTLFVLCLTVLQLFAPKI